MLALTYNLIKYYVILLREFSRNLKPEILEKKYPNMKWREFIKTSEFNAIRLQTKNSLDEGEKKVLMLYDECRDVLHRIKPVNPTFDENLKP